MKNMKNLKRILSGLCLLFLISGNLWAQDITEMMRQAEEAGIDKTALTDLQNRAEERGMNNQQLSQILQTAIGMSEQNLPADIAVRKALEGLSKGITGDRLVPAIERVQQSTARAVEMIEPWMEKNADVQKMIDRSGGSKEQFRNDMARATSKSLIQNIDAGTVSSILDEIGSESLLDDASSSDIIAAMNVLPDLPSAGNDPGKAGAFLVRALREGFKADDLHKLPSALKIAQQRSELPAASVVDGVAGQMREGVPARQILQNLFDGNIGGGPPGNVPKGLENKQNRGTGNNSNG